MEGAGRPARAGRRYDAQRLGGVAVELKSHLPIERQARVIGATWLDQQLIGGGSGLGDLGFGGEAKQAMQQRADFLAEQGLAERRGQRVILARNLLGTLRSRELAQAAKDIAAETGLEHRPWPMASAWRASTAAASCSPAGATRCSMTAWGSAWCRGGRSSNNDSVCRFLRRYMTAAYPGKSDGNRAYLLSEASSISSTHCKDASTSVLDVDDRNAPDAHARNATFPGISTWSAMTPAAALPMSAPAAGTGDACIGNGFANRLGGERLRPQSMCLPKRVMPVPATKTGCMESV
jgi:hypothetical protein